MRPRELGSSAPEDISAGLQPPVEGGDRFSLGSALIKRTLIGAVLYGGVVLVGGEITVQLFRNFPIDATDPKIVMSQQTVDYARFVFFPQLSREIAVLGGALGAATAAGEWIYRRVPLFRS